MILRPVLLPIAVTTAASPQDRVAEQSRRARLALVECARISGAPEIGWTKDANGAPQANNSWHWSIAHTREWSAAIVAREPVGIDVEKIRPRREALFDHVASDEEWNRIGGRSWECFFRMWTAKEAVLKACGCGIGWLLECMATKTLPTDRWALEFRDRDWQVEHFAFADHIAAVTCNEATVQWQIGDSTPEVPRHPAKE
jgi:phosphopantetheinyl transferase